MVDIVLVYLSLAPWLGGEVVYWWSLVQVLQSTMF
ncbi:hypothetical protein LCGC14_1744040 [marine sediment metagenome]|uniref:Uncharacterized protein n=1 Tax=marine sediment metagenome TaxID=412755 RepID=A0A0F9H5W5_9ZZZZ